VPELYHGRFVNLEKADGNLLVHLNSNGQRIFKEIQGIRDRLGSDPAFRVLLDEFFKRQWTEIKPEEIAALHCCPRAGLRGMCFAKWVAEIPSKLLKLPRIFRLQRCFQFVRIHWAIPLKLTICQFPA
jgi:hypothetical protein